MGAGCRKLATSTFTHVLCMIESSSIQSVQEGEKEFVIANDKALSAGFVFYTSLVSPTSNHFSCSLSTQL